uniref:spatacsin-like n=1 Tax=Solea senegalensis TaxID=28829 RepID=UPI001CD90FBA|nr:spatacsin-like [Solea senegalensis]
MKLLQEVNSQKSKPQWRRLETRVSFWKKCQEQLKTDGTDPRPASQFFLSQAKAPSVDTQTELPDVQEHCLLLGIAAHWLSLLAPPPGDELESLEKTLWRNQVRRQVLTAAMEKESVFNLPPPSVTSEMNTYEVLMREFSFSNISALNTERFLSVEGLPTPCEEQQQQQQEQEEVNDGSGLSPEERRVLSTLIGRLLDNGSVHEASRVCRYFSLYHSDVWVVLRCRGLASGELHPRPPEEASEPVLRSSIASSSSFSSLSLAMFPLPEDDDVVVELQRLLDQCRHGNNYCKQVLSLYQLSKELQSSFSQVCREEPRSVLEMLLLSDQPERFRKAQAFIRAQGLSADTVAQLVSSAVAHTLLASSTQDLQPGENRRLVFGKSVYLLLNDSILLNCVCVCVCVCETGVHSQRADFDPTDQIKSDDPNGIKLMENINTVPLRPESQ